VKAAGIDQTHKPVIVNRSVYRLNSGRSEDEKHDRSLKMRHNACGSLRAATLQI
jgi:hypothetical protein